MKINKVELRNFKFHHELDIDILGNCLIYGENGTGKSSIFEALHTSFYKNNKLDVYETFKNRNYLGEDLIVNIHLDDHKILKRNNNDIDYKDFEVIDDSSGKLFEKISISLDTDTIYCLNERILTRVTKENFYKTIKETLQEHFTELKQLNIFDTFAKDLKRTTQFTDELRDKRDELDQEFDKLFKKLVPKENINKILKELNAKFEIEFKTSHSENTTIFQEPTIQIMIKGINNNGKLYNHFNEAKLKLISIAIYFSLAKKYENESNYKLLVLDDFLTSLDMSNRKRIIQYILDNFSEYQIIILTHNLQFFNLIKKLTKDWDIKQMFILEETDGYVSHIKNDTNYLQQAESFLKTTDYNLETAGHKLRKAYESIMQDFSQLLELGRYDSLENIVKTIKDADDLYFNPKQANLLIKDIFEIIQSTDTNDVTQKIEQKILDFQSLSIVEVEIDKVKKNPAETIIYHVNRAIIYKQILLNPASHNDSEATLYRSECFEALELLKNLNKIKKQLK